MTTPNFNAYESDVQAWILASLGEERVEMVADKRRGLKPVSMNLWVRQDGRGMFWRANAGMFRPLSGKGIVRGNPRGCSDIVGVVDGVPVFIEVKRLGRNGKPMPQRPAQRDFQHIVRKAGAVYVVVTNPNEARVFVDAILAGRLDPSAAVQQGATKEPATHGSV